MYSKLSTSIILNAQLKTFPTLSLEVIVVRTDTDVVPNWRSDCRYSFQSLQGNLNQYYGSIGGNSSPRCRRNFI